MKQTSQFPFKLLALGIQVLLLWGHVLGGIITNQDSLALPMELADALTVLPPPPTNNNSRTGRDGTDGRVIYTAPYSNVRISSTEPKSLKYFPSATYTNKLTKANIAIVPVFESTTSTTTTKVPSSPAISTLSPSTSSAKQILPETEIGTEATTGNIGNDVVTKSISS